MTFTLSLVIAIFLWRTQPSGWKKQLLLILAMMPVVLAGIIRSALALLQWVGIR